jgi:CYTH domain-containing protein
LKPEDEQGGRTFPSVSEYREVGPREPIREGKYARIEWERRFLMAGPPARSALIARRITDRYLAGTRLRLRHIQRPDSGEREYKLTQKLPADQAGPVQGLITNIYLSPSEYEVLSTLPAAVLSKTRLSIPPLGIDVFDGPMRGLVMAEAEFTSDAAARAFDAPPYCIAEVTDDVRFTGGRLAHAERSDLLTWLADYNLSPDCAPPPS